MLKTGNLGRYYYREKGQFRVVIRMVKKEQFRVVIRVVKGAV